MDVFEAKKIAVSLMVRHGLIDITTSSKVRDWTFNFDCAKRRFGVCKYRKKEISLSMHLTLLNDVRDVTDTILHEIAHALVGPGHGHDAVWVAKAKEIGCNGQRCYNSKNVNTPQGKYEAVCKGCGHVHKKFKQVKKTTSCGYCCRKFNPDFVLDYKKI